MSSQNECFSVGALKVDLGSRKVKIVVASCSSALAAEFRMAQDTGDKRGNRDSLLMKESLRESAECTAFHPR